MKAITAGCVASAAMLFVVGCDGGGGSSGKGFGAKADAVCATDAQADLAASRSPASSTAAAREQVRALVAARTTALGKLRALSPPHSERASYERFVAQWPAVESAWRQGAGAVAKGAAAYDAGGGATASLTSSFAAAASVKGLVACAGKLPASDVGAITSFIRSAELHPTASVCTQETSKRFLAVTGGLRSCLQSTKTHSAAVTISNLRGTAPIASAQVSRTGGNQPAARLTFWLVKLGGRWQLDDAY